MPSASVSDCGFLGMLHMEIMQQRLESEHDLDLITTAPTVVYEIMQVDESVLYVDNPSKLPDANKIEEFREPIARVNILVPQEFVGNVITLCVERRGSQINMQYLGKQVALTYDIPMAEVVLDFFDRIKSVSRGFASMDYACERFEATKRVRVDVLINGNKVDALAKICHLDQSA